TPASTVLIGPHGTPAALSAVNQSAAGRVVSRAASSGRSCSRLPVRAWLVANRGASATAGTPSTSHNLRNCPSLAAATIRSRSAVGSGSYGYTLGWELPIRNGIPPPATYALAWFTIADRADASRLTSTCWPSPVTDR